jgi:hypothetical protein
MLTGCGIGFKKYTIEGVSQVLYDEGLICSRELNLIEYPSGIQAYLLRSVLCLPGRLGGEYGGRIEIYPTRSELKRVTRGFAEAMSKGYSTYSQFVKGNVVITVLPALSGEDAERFRHALESLE